MRYLCVVVLLCLFPLFHVKAQDSIPYLGDFRLYEGLYINYQDLRFNWPIPKEKIITDINKDQLDFYSKLLENEEIKYYERDSSVRKIKTSSIFGYCQNNFVFINYENYFYRIPVFGNISYFLGTIEVRGNYTNMDPFMNAPMNSTAFKTREFKQFLLDFYSGELSLFTIEKAEEYLKRDPEIYKEYDALSKKKKKDLISRYIRMYNDKHPVYFPKG
ncbi:MAG: hypothetical protein JST26_04450 [Bacteroidetes bacterium]|nr:hypothetical protein [Bacteroidota bacterium]